MTLKKDDDGGVDESSVVHKQCETETHPPLPIVSDVGEYCLMLLSEVFFIGVVKSINSLSKVNICGNWINDQKHKSKDRC